MKTTEQLAREATRNAHLHGWKEYTLSFGELETFRRLAIEDFVAGLEPVAAFRHKESGAVRYVLIGAEHDESDWEDVAIVPLYSLEGGKK